MKYYFDIITKTGKSRSFFKTFAEARKVYNYYLNKYNYTLSISKVYKIIKKES